MINNGYRNYVDLHLFLNPRIFIFMRFLWCFGCMRGISCQAAGPSPAACHEIVRMQLIYWWCRSNVNFWNWNWFLILFSVGAHGESIYYDLWILNGYWNLVSPSCAHYSCDFLYSCDSIGISAACMEFCGRQPGLAPLLATGLHACSCYTSGVRAMWKFRDWGSNSDLV